VEIFRAAVATISREALWTAVAPATALNLVSYRMVEFVNLGFVVTERV
jgi:hypothetical protein